MKCTVRILSTIDDKSTLFSSDGEMNVTPFGFDVKYQMDGVDILLKSANNIISMLRQGEYGLYLPFEKGKRSKGLMQFSSSSSGALDIQTQEAAWSYEKGKLSVVLEYELLFGNDEKQKTKVRVVALQNKE